ncbi:MAG: nucleotidyltransferase [Flavobacterium sp. BFFFF1]|uniref:nucleotidyltransferase domain-containing protein n=1 Tax=Flavobacterium sp. BFFFF1 TaxID=2015557 RepID=UPI000BC88DAF|nr:nucleotidyltransferase domain-containing protein [Flavobacterium sp. BFFFF1]OYU82272.1 MAG: nucleotidyltransferase [Flavobacterium sp. BFFFF1]
MESLKTILYFSLFKYPLKLEEICRFSISKDCPKIETELRDLVAKKVIFQIEDYYYPEYDPSCLEKRKNGNKMAADALLKAKERARLISKFPFVEAVGVSGSLSKGYYDNDSDIDFFVITKPGKLWLSRTFLMLYKKIFLLNSRKYFCINYFMSSSSLEIEEKNRFTATEIKTLLPFEGREVFEEFYNKNEWVSHLLGQHDPKLEDIGVIEKPSGVKALEAALSTKFGEFLDVVFKKTTVAFWKLKFRQMHTEDFKVALKSTKNISKHHPLNFQKKVIGALNEKYEEIRINHNIELQREYV